MQKLLYDFFARFAVPENKDTDLGSLKKILVVRQHNQLGDVLAGVPLFRAIKEKYPSSHLTVIASPVFLVFLLLYCMKGRGQQPL